MDFRLVFFRSRWGAVAAAAMTSGARRSPILDHRFPSPNSPATDPSAGAPMTAPPAIEADGLVKHFGETVAVDGVSFSVPEGTVLGMLGPNGAGKATTVRMMTTLTTPTSGTARVAGHRSEERRVGAECVSTCRLWG